MNSSRWPRSGPRRVTWNQGLLRPSDRVRNWWRQPSSHCWRSISLSPSTQTSWLPSDWRFPNQLVSRMVQRLPSASDDEIPVSDSAFSGPTNIAALGGLYFGCEAAHVQWHAYDGPDSVDNGFAVEPTLHELFDAGAWTLTDDRKILVSADLTGTETAVIRVRSLHGEWLRPPLSGELEISVAYIRWHRESDQGCVFRHPALPL